MSDDVRTERLKREREERQRGDRFAWGDDEIGHVVIEPRPEPAKPATPQQG